MRKCLTRLYMKILEECEYKCSVCAREVDYNYQRCVSIIIIVIKATPEKFQFSVKVPETVTHDKRLNVEKGAIIFSRRISR